MGKFGLTEERYSQMMKSYGNDESAVKDVVETWGVETCNKGYSTFNYHGTGLIDIEAVGDVDAFEDDIAVNEAEKDGISIIPVEQLPVNIPENMRFYGWVDTPENRENIARYCMNQK